MSEQKFTRTSRWFLVDTDFETAFSQLGLTSIEAVFSFNPDKNLSKDNLARFRSRHQFEIDSPPASLFMKRYDTPPISAQLRNWLCHRRRVSMARFEFDAARKLAAAGINTPKFVALGEQWGIFFEKRSFIITEKVPDAESLERKLPRYISAPATVQNLKLRRDFVARLATLTKKFHETGYCHRDLYFSHIFYRSSGRFYLIDLARAFKPALLRRRFQVKDIAQLYYSAPRKYFSRTDRLRFFFKWTGRNKLTGKDKAFIRKVVSKAKRMARHDIKHGRPVPFAS